MDAPFTIYIDLGCYLKKWENEKMRKNNPKKSPTTKLNKHTPSRNSMFTHYSFDATKNKLDCYGD